MTEDEIQFDNVTRIEIIGPGGREYARYFEKGIVLNLQDDGKTIKLFVGEIDQRFKFDRDTE